MPASASPSGFRIGQIASASLVALAHGTNDAQKTMGVIMLALVANGNLGKGADVPLWVIVGAATAISLGTFIGGWRIIRTLGHRLSVDRDATGLLGRDVERRRDPRRLPGRLCAVDDARDVGRRDERRGRQERGGGALGDRRAHRDRVAAPLPAAAAVAGAVYFITDEIGARLAGPVVVCVLAAIAAGALFLHTHATAPVTASDV